MWSMVAQQLTQILPPAATPDQLWQRVEAACSAVPQEHIQSLFESMPRRVAVVTPFEFLQVWLSNNCNTNSNNGAICLLNIQPQQLPQILTNKIDGPLLNGLLMAIKAMANAGKMTEGFEYLKSLIKVPRIKVTTSFLSTKEKTDIRIKNIYCSRKNKSCETSEKKCSFDLRTEKWNNASKSQQAP
ncbi:sperm-associated antigen 1 [Trichonephila clavipes]|nr:sperm-associated antigen 1 [Trichonephila clavipes]